MFQKCFYFVIFVFIEIAYAAENNSQLIFSTKECFLNEPVHGYKFDFTPLNTDFGHLAFSDIGDQFEFNICGNLHKKCNNQTNVSACLTKDNKEYILGTQQELNYQNGKMFFSFTNGSQCPYSSSGEFYQLHVIIGCDYSLDKNQSNVTPYSPNACLFYIILETPHACLPQPDNVASNTCSVKDPETGHIYDLFSLSDNNYRTTDRQGSNFVINICKPVLYGENAMCPAGSSVCFVSLRATNIQFRFLDYGTANTNLVIMNDHLQLVMPSPTPYNKTHNCTSTINFYCDMEVKNGHPELISSDNCSYVFTFATPLACSNLTPCTAVTHKNEILNMSALMNQPFTLSFQNKNYTIGVCSAAKSPCLENDGACFTENGQSSSLGYSNTNLRFNQSGTPYLLYEGGAACQKSTSADSTTTAISSWSTKIEFVCANSATKNDKNNNINNDKSLSLESTTGSLAAGPKIIENSNCQLLIHYQTKLTCLDQIECKAKYYSDDGTGVVDLTPLISVTENYEAQIDANLIKKNIVGKTTKFFLNICRPLVPKFGLGCPGGSAACKAILDANSPTPEAEQSLGYPSEPLVAYKPRSATLLYPGGSICSTNKKSQMTTKITFNCDMRAGRGTPILRSINDCRYEFEWATNVICPQHECIFDENTCEIVNDDINVRFKLKNALFTDKGKIKVSIGKTEFDINLCGNHLKAVTDYSQYLVNLYFTTAGMCKSNGLLNVQMRLICSSTTGITTTFTDKTQCNLLYVIHTPEICAFLSLKVSADSQTPSTTTPTAAKPIEPISGDAHTAEHGANIGVALTIILSLVVLIVCLTLVLHSPERRQIIRRFFQRTTSAVRYSRVRSNEEANLLLDPNGEFSESDDDMLL